MTKTNTVTITQAAATSSTYTVTVTVLLIGTSIPVVGQSVQLYNTVTGTSVYATTDSNGNATFFSVPNGTYLAIEGSNNTAITVNGANTGGTIYVV